MIHVLFVLFINDLKKIECENFTYLENLGFHLNLFRNEKVRMKSIFVGFFSHTVQNLITWAYTSFQ